MRDSRLQGTEALLNRAHFRELRLTSLSGLTLCSLPLWAHAYWLTLPGWAVWIAVLMTSMLFSLAAAYGLMERTSRVRSPSAGAVVVAVRWPELEELRSALMWTTASLTVVPWVSALGYAPPEGILAAVGPVAAVVLGPATGLELLALARDLPLPYRR